VLHLVKNNIHTTASRSIKTTWKGDYTGIEYPGSQFPDIVIVCFGLPILTPTLYRCQ